MTMSSLDLNPSHCGDQLSATEQKNAVSIAVIETEVAHLKAGLVDLKVTNVQLSAKLDDIMRRMDEAKGGYRVLLLLGGAAGTVGGGIGWMLSHWRG